MQTVAIILYLLTSFAIIGLIMLQQGKGADAGASFGGGASQTVFGSQGSSNFLSKATAWLAATFFVIALFLTWYAKQQVVVSGAPLVDESLLQHSVDSEIPTIEDNSSDSDIPALDAGNDSDIEVPDIPAVAEEAAEDVVEQVESAVEETSGNN